MMNVPGSVCLSRCSSEQALRWSIAGGVIAVVFILALLAGDLSRTAGTMRGLVPAANPVSSQVAPHAEPGHD